MENKYIVRADFYPNGTVVPLGITKGDGTTIYIKKTIESEVKDNNELEFKCLTEKGECKLLLNCNRWTVYIN